MRSQKQLRDELQFVDDFSTLCDVMQRVAVTQLHRLDEHLAPQVPVTPVLAREFFPLLPMAARHELLGHGATEGRLVVAITSDEGFVGPLHAAVMHRAIEKAGAGAHWMVIGQRGMRWLGEQPSASRHVMPIPPDEAAEEQMQHVAQFVMAAYRRYRLSEAWLIAPRFVSMARQEIAEYRLVPLPEPAPSQALHASNDRDLVMEPSPARVIERVSMTWVAAVCVEAYWSARRAEAAARALHLEAARRELAKRAQRIRYQCFKALHERMDVLVRETCVVQRHVVRQRAQSGTRYLEVPGTR